MFEQIFFQNNFFFFDTGETRIVKKNGCQKTEKTFIYLPLDLEISTDL